MDYDLKILFIGRDTKFKTLYGLTGKDHSRLLAQRNDCCHNIKENVLNDRIAYRDMTIAIIFLAQTIVGILGNFSLLYHYLFLSHTGCRLKATDLILKHLTISNSLIILSKGVSQTMEDFGLKYFVNDFGCDLLLYVDRVGRTVSIGTTCLLSVFQTIMISPMNSYCKDLKVKVPRYIGLSISLCWILFMFVNLTFPMYALYVSNKWSMKNMTKKRDFGYCFAIDPEITTGSIYVALIVFPEVSFSVIIIWASGSMIFTLYRHKQRVQHIHRKNISHRSSPESRATQSILILLITFVSFQTLSSIFHLCISLIYKPNRWLVKTASLMSGCFPTVTPFLLMSRDSTVSSLFSAWIRKTKFPSLTGKM
ncbi:vomeronasal type-1 receptor 4-like [Diceros bicornis minor]|uniref:vomeronasal type-1 receptor 4-like n=1 Tax=Diceros bicornis minor TaxID=77932 RepID=UPI0026EDC16A|nr:vomeronasal type-1 receptor 4-like [Diceros bicornis minor]